MRLSPVLRLWICVAPLILCACGAKKPGGQTAGKTPDVVEQTDGGVPEEPAEEGDADAGPGEQPDIATGETPPVPELDLPQRCASLPALPPRESGTLRIVTINTDGGHESLRESTLVASKSMGLQRDHLKCLGGLLVAMQADVAFLSEVHSHSRYWSKHDMAEEIRAAAEEASPGWAAVFGTTCLLPPSRKSRYVGSAGNAFIVRTSAAGPTPGPPGLLEVDYDDDPDNGLELYYSFSLPTEIPSPEGGQNLSKRDENCFVASDSFTHNRGRQKSAIMALAFGLELIGVHLSPGRRNDDQRTAQLAYLAKMLETFRHRVDEQLGSSAPRPTVVLGDLNEGDEIYHRFKSQIGEKGWRNATKQIKFDNKIDHIFVKDLEVVRAEQLHLPGFLNHHVIFVDVRVPNR